MILATDEEIARMKTVSDRLAVIRRATVITSGFQNEIELADALLAFISRVGQELIDGGSLSEEQARGVRGTLNDTPIAFAALSCVPLPDEEKANLVFILVKLMDEMLSLGATAMVAGNEDIARSVINGGRLGGQLSTAIRREKQMAWQDQALKLAKDMVKKNGKRVLS
jgi:hypothetical protein